MHSMLCYVLCYDTNLHQFRAFFQASSSLTQTTSDTIFRYEFKRLARHGVRFFLAGGNKIKEEKRQELSCWLDDDDDDDEFDARKSLLLLGLCCCRLRPRCVRTYILCVPAHVGNKIQRAVSCDKKKW